MRTSITCCALMLLAVGTARADWQYTRWGMTAEEVWMASNRSAMFSTDPAFSKDQNVQLASGEYTGFGYKFSVRFLFDRNTQKLTVVHLTAKDPSQCSEIRGKLSDGYGEPTTRSASQVHQLAKWMVQEKGENVTYLKTGMDGATGLAAPYCSISYSPILERGGKGGL